MYKIFILLILAEFALALEDNSNNSTSQSVEPRVLSRRKRFLIFPDGSSFQLVFCTQNHGYLQIGDIVWFGNTAALAWELPTDPQLFHIFKDHEKDFAQNRNGVSKLIYFLDQDGKVLSKVPYKRKPIVNPAFAKRSITSNTRKLLHKNQKQQDHLDTSSIEFHRMGRKSFYSHLEKFIRAIGWSGEECVLRLLCEFGKSKGVAGRGIFLEEIMRAIFTLPESKTSLEPYDIAHNSHGRCDELYRCEEYNSINI